MAGSYGHIVDKDNNFIGIKYIENLGDAYEALEECWYLIDILSGGDKKIIKDTHIKYIERIKGNVDYAKQHGPFDDKDEENIDEENSDENEN